MLNQIARLYFQKEQVCVCVCVGGGGGATIGPTPGTTLGSCIN